MKAQQSNLEISRKFEAQKVPTFHLIVYLNQGLNWFPTICCKPKYGGRFSQPMHIASHFYTNW